MTVNTEKLYGFVVYVSNVASEINFFKSDFKGNNLVALCDKKGVENGFFRIPENGIFNLNVCKRITLGNGFALGRKKLLAVTFRNIGIDISTAEVIGKICSDIYIFDTVGISFKNINLSENT